MWMPGGRVAGAILYHKHVVFAPVILHGHMLSAYINRDLAAISHISTVTDSVVCMVHITNSLEHTSSVHTDLFTILDL